VIAPAHVRTEFVVGKLATIKVKGLEFINALSDVNSSVMTKADVTAIGAVKKNVKVDPPFTVVRTGATEPPIPYVGTEKSEDSATAAPAASKTVMVHDIGSLTLTYVVAMLVFPMHSKVEAVVAELTLKVKVLPEIGAVVSVSFSVI
jgi:hypothetical protein